MNFLLVLIIHTHIYHDVIEKHDDAANDTPNSISTILLSEVFNVKEVYED